MKKRWLWLCIALLVCNVAFIWGNSALPAHISASISGFVRDIVSLVMDGGGGGEATVGEGVLRKIAHFLEFSCLGLLFFWLYSMLNKPWFYGFGCGVAVACVDETIQRFVPGRGPRITDVLLDSAGVACGMAVLLLCVTIYQKKKK